MNVLEELEEAKAVYEGLQQIVFWRNGWWWNCNGRVEK